MAKRYYARHAAVRAHCGGSALRLSPIWCWQSPMPRSYMLVVAIPLEHSCMGTGIKNRSFS